MDIKDLQNLYDNAIKTIADNGCYIENGKVKESKEVYVISVTGTFYDQCMGDGDWRYREVSGDKIITEEQAKILTNGIVECDDVDDDNEAALVQASKLLNKILGHEDDSFTELYCTESGEFNHVTKTDDFVCFDEKSKNRWNFDFNIHKKQSRDVEEFKIDDKFGCI